MEAWALPISLTKKERLSSTTLHPGPLLWSSSPPLTPMRISRLQSHPKGNSAREESEASSRWGPKWLLFLQHLLKIPPVAYPFIEEGDEAIAFRFPRCHVLNHPCISRKQKQEPVQHLIKPARLNSSHTYSSFSPFTFTKVNCLLHQQHSQSKRLRF